MPKTLYQMGMSKRIMTAKVIGYMKPDIDPNVRLYVPFNEGVGGIAKDYSQYGNHAQLTAVKWSPDGFNGAGKFNGSSSFGDCGNDSSLDIANAITIEVWVKLDEDVIQVILSKAESIGMIAYTPNQGFYFTPTALAWDEGVKTGVVTTPTTWHHLVGVYEVGVEKRIYLDTIFSTTTGGDRNPGTGISLELGRRSGFDDYHFNGTIDEVRIYNRARSAAQIAADRYEGVCS